MNYILPQRDTKAITKVHEGLLNQLQFKKGFPKDSISPEVRAGS